MLVWRPRPELNRGTRFCRPLRNHSATWPFGSPYMELIVHGNSILTRAARSNHSPRHSRAAMSHDATKVVIRRIRLGSARNGGCP
jgi:hypothetical protein